MNSIKPIPYQKFEKFLKEIGCLLVSKEGDHRKWDRSDLIRPVIVRALKDLPAFEIKSNLRTLGMTNQQYFDVMSRL